MPLLQSLIAVALAMPAWMLLGTAFGITWMLRDRLPTAGRLALLGFGGLLVVDVGVTALWFCMDLAWQLDIVIPAVVYRGLALGVNAVMALGIGVLVVAATRDRA